MPETPKQPKSLLTLPPDSVGKRSPKPSLADNERQSFSSLGSGDNAREVHTKILLKARSMEKLDDTHKESNSNSTGVSGTAKKEKKTKKSKRKESLDGSGDHHYTTSAKPDPPTMENHDEGTTDKKDRKKESSSGSSSGKAHHKLNATAVASSSGKASEPASPHTTETGSSGGNKSKGRDRSPEKASRRSRSPDKMSRKGRDASKGKKKRLDLTDPSLGLREVMRAESRARIRAMSPSKRTENPLDQPTYKPYHSNMGDDHSESTAGTMEADGKKKKKKSKKAKRASSTDRESKSSSKDGNQSPRGRSMSMGYQTVRRVNRSLSGEKMDLPIDDPPLGTAPDPIIGPATAAPTDEKGLSTPVRKKKKKKQPDGADGNHPPTTPDIHKEQMNGSSNHLDTSFPSDEDGTPKRASSIKDSSTNSPKPSKPGLVSLLRQASPRSPNREVVKLSSLNQRPLGTRSEHSDSNKGEPSPRRLPRRAIADQASSRSMDSDGPHRDGSDRGTPSSKRRTRIPESPVVLDNSGKEIPLPLRPDEDSEVKKSNAEGKKGHKKAARRNSLRAPPKNPKLVQQLKECVRLVAADETGPAVEASLRGLAEYLSSKHVSSETSNLVADVLMADFKPRQQEPPPPGSVEKASLGSGSVETDDSDDHDEAAERHAQEEKVVFDPYKPPTPKHESLDRVGTAGTTSSDEGQSSVPKANASGQSSVETAATSTTSSTESTQPILRPKTSLPTNPPEIRRQTKPSQPTIHPQQQQPRPPQQQQAWTEEQRRQYFAQQSAQQQKPVPPQQYQQQGPHFYAGQQAPPQHYQQPRPPVQSQQYQQSFQAPQGHPNQAYVQHPGGPSHQVPRVSPHPTGPHGQQGHYQYPPQQAQQQPVRPAGAAPVPQYPQQYPQHQQSYPQHAQFQQQQPRPQNVQAPPQQYAQQPHPQPVPPPQHQPTNQPPSQSTPSYVPHGASEAAGDALKPLRQAILREWALQPPTMTALRPIEHLLVSVQNVLPPKLGVPSHDYFSKWTALAITDLWPDGARLDQNALKKSLRKIRVFLHPDRLPGDFSEPHTFVCKLLWDVIQDAETEYKKKAEELDWVG